MKKLIILAFLTSLSSFTFCQIIIKDYETEKEFTKDDGVKVTLTQSIVGRLKTEEYFDEETGTTKTRKRVLQDLRNCGNKSYIYSENDRLNLARSMTCVDNEAENPSLRLDVKIDAVGYEPKEFSLTTRLDAPNFELYSTWSKYPKKEPNAIFLKRIK